MITELMRQPIVDLDAAKAFCNDLIAHDMVFHFEDSPDSIIQGVKGARLFTDAEAEVMVDRVAELYAQDWGAHECPIGYVLDMTDGTGWRTRA